MKKTSIILTILSLLCCPKAWSQTISYDAPLHVGSSASPQYGVEDVAPMSHMPSDEEIYFEEMYYDSLADNKPAQNIQTSAPVSQEPPSQPQGMGITDAFANVDETGTQTTDSSGKKTWIGQLATKGKSDSSLSLEGMVETAKKSGSRRSNASVFDISGVMLRMSVDQVEKAMSNRGFKKVMARTEVPNFIKWRNEEKCRAQGVIGYERLASCVVQMARKDNHEYIEVMSFAKYDTQEEIEVRFTSNFTNNKVYKIIYTSLAPTIKGNSAKALYIRNIKVYDFWKKINQKYGEPDDKESVIWGLGDNKPYMQATTGRLMLEDPMLRELDYTRMSREDQRFMNTNMYSF